VSGTGSASGGRGARAGSPVLLSLVVAVVVVVVVLLLLVGVAVLVLSAPLLLLVVGGGGAGVVLPALSPGSARAGGEHEGREGEQRDRDDTGDHRRPIYHAGRMPGTPASM
jgi:threonine/homoserine/homoserine lactone efflux protein